MNLDGYVEFYRAFRPAIVIRRMVQCVTSASSEGHSL